MYQTGHRCIPHSLYQSFKSLEFLRIQEIFIVYKLERQFKILYISEIRYYAYGLL